MCGGEADQLWRGLLFLKKCSVKPASSAKEGQGEEALPFVLSCDRHKGLRLTALETPGFVPLKLERSSVNLEEVVVCFSGTVSRGCV